MNTETTPARVALIVVLTVINLLFCPAGFAAGQGRLLEVTVHGRALEGNIMGVAADRAVSVYLPPSYDDSQRRYPVVFVLHGIMDSNRTWTRPWQADDGYATMQDLMDKGIAQGMLREMIIVIPDSDKSCHYTDSPVKGNWDQFIAQDLVSFVDATWRTIPHSAARGITGHSMGGHGAIKIGMKHPDVFSLVYAMNPSLLGWGGDLSADNPALAGLADLHSPEDLARAHFYIQAVVGTGQCFSPNPKAPFLTDLVFGPVAGGIAAAQPGHDRWRSQMPLYMLDDHVDRMKALKGLRFDSAFEDEFTHIPVTSLAFSQALDKAGIAHRFEMYNGDHRNRLWGRQGRLFTEVLPWFSGLLEAVPASNPGARSMDTGAGKPSGQATGPAVEALWKAARKGEIAAAEKALAAGAEINALDTSESVNGRRALNYAAWHNQPAMVKWLVAQGADPNLANKTGFTPLHHAAENGSLEAAKALLELGADKDLRNRAGHTPLDTARKLGRTELTALLSAAGPK